MPAAKAVSPIVIFRPGTHTATNGTTLDFSEDMLAGAVAAYDPALHDAPLVIGHPKDTAPAYGWVQSMALGSGGVVAVNPHQVNADFAEVVRAKAYKKVSASWYLPDAPANPKPGSLYLRHVAFLGAVPPALKGLPPVEFAEGEAGVVTIDFAEVPTWQRASAWRSVAALFRGLRDRLVEDKGAEAAEALMPGYSIDNLTALAEAESNAGDTPNYSEPNPEDPVADPKPDINTAADFAERDARIATLETQVRRGANERYLDGLVAEGRPLPLAKTNLLDFMEAIAAGSGTIDFGEADGGKKTPLDAFKVMLGGLPKQVDFAERAPGDPGSEGMDDPTDTARLAVCYQEEMRGKGVAVSTTEAVAHVRKEGGK